MEVNIHEGEINHNFLHQFDVVIFTDFHDRKKLIDYNNFCRTREKPIGFILGGILGLYGFTFVDFGPGFTVVDKDGEDTRTAIISMITNDNPATVTTHEDKRHGFVDGDVVRFKEVDGMCAINGKEFEIKVNSPHSFSIKADTTNYDKYLRNGLAEQVKVHHQLTFKSLEDSLQAPLGGDFPGFENPDLEKWGRPEQLHIAYNALLQFIEGKSSLPRLNNEDDAKELVDIYRQINDSASTDKPGTVKADEVNEELIKNIARFAAAQTSCHASFFGGIVAQEVVKYIGKFNPIRQWLHYENFELLPEGKVNRKLHKSRYDDQIAIFGQEFQEKLMDKR